MKNKEIRFNYDLQEFVNKIIDGEENALLFLGQIKRLENELKAIKDKIIENAINEFETYEEKSLHLGNFVFSKTQSGRYSYKHSHNWIKISEKQKKLQDLMQDAYRANEKGNVIVNPETGEVIEPAYYTANKPSLSIKLKK